MKDIVTINDFSKLDLRAGTVINAQRKDGSDKLIRLTVDFGNDQRIIFTALYPIYEPDFFQGKQFVFIYNLAPRKMMDEQSEGMFLAFDNERPIPLIPQTPVPNGAQIR